MPYAILVSRKIRTANVGPISGVDWTQYAICVVDALDDEKLTKAHIFKLFEDRGWEWKPSNKDPILALDMETDELVTAAHASKGYNYCIQAAEMPFWTSELRRFAEKHKAEAE